MCVCIFSFSYAACKAHAPYYIVICGLYDSTTLVHITSSTAWFRGRGGGELLITKYVFWLFPHLLFETFLILRRIQWDIIINVRKSSRIIPVILGRFFSTGVSEKILITHSHLASRWPVLGWTLPFIKCNENTSSGSRCSIQTDMTRLTVALRNFANAPKSTQRPRAVKGYWLRTYVRLCIWNGCIRFVFRYQFQCSYRK